MKKVKSNIWTLFLTLTTVATLGFLALLSFDYRHLVKEVELKLETNVQLIANSIAYKLAEEELLLTAVGKELLDDKKTEVQKQKYLDKVLQKNPDLAGLGFLDVNGYYLYLSSNITLSKHMNIIQNDSVADYYQKTLESQNIVVGKTAYFTALKEWVIPLRKAIRDENNEILGVVTTGILNSKNQNFIDQLQLLDKYNIVIVKDSDKYGEFFRQYASGLENIPKEILYLKPIDKQLISAIGKFIYRKYQLNINEIKKKGLIASFEAKDALGEDQLWAMAYDKKYGLWIIVKQDYIYIKESMYRSSFIYVSIFLAVFILLFWLFKRLSQSEIRSKNELIFQAEHDELTRLPNRIYMYKHISEWMKVNNELFFVLYVDLDNFKNINDKFGHTVGDKILQEVAKRLNHALSYEDMLIRQGGDEFILFLTHKYKNTLDTICLSLISSVSELYTVEKNEFRIGLSIGISRYPDDSRDVNELLSFADTAMYKAKQHKNYFTYFSEDMRHENVLKSDIEHELRGAIDNKEFYMTYQPQIDLEGHVCGVEALLRWHNEKLGFVGPDIFISVAEQTGMMDDIGEFIMKTSLREIKKIQEETGKVFTLSLNISVVQFMENNFLNKLMQLILDEGFEKSLLTLEVTESLSISDLDKMVPLLEKIRQEGIEVSLDDFGTGYSSLSILRKLPIHELKIDKSFIDEIVYDMSERKLVQSIIEIGKNFDMKTVAEGVENKEQLEILKTLECDIIQGYYYSKPLKIEQLKYYLEKEHM